MAAMSRLGETADETGDDVARGPLRLSAAAVAAPSDRAAEFGEGWWGLLPFFLAHDSDDGGNREFLDLENRVVHATMSRSRRTCATAWDSSV